MRLERFVEAVEAPESGLTHTALVGSHKQSVEDVERLFGFALIEFMEEKQYNSEAKYLKVIRNWRRAVDERGLPDATRQIFNKELLDFILDDLMPWHWTAGMRNFSLMKSIDIGYSTDSTVNTSMGGCQPGIEPSRMPPPPISL